MIQISVLIFTQYIHLSRSSKSPRRKSSPRLLQTPWLICARELLQNECLLGVTRKSVRAGHILSPSLRPAAVGRATELCPALSDFLVTPRRHNQSLSFWQVSQCYHKQGEDSRISPPYYYVPLWTFRPPYGPVLCCKTSSFHGTISRCVVTYSVDE